MRLFLSITLLILILTLSSYKKEKKFASEYEQLVKLELLALKRENIGQAYKYDLTHKKDCNKTTIKYLGKIKTISGKQYKVLSSFFAYTAASTCHGTSNIKFYDTNNRFIGKYSVGMPDDLPSKISKNKFLHWINSEDCNQRKGFFINFHKGLPNYFFLPCSKNGGDECYFSGK